MKIRRVSEESGIDVGTPDKTKRVQSVVKKDLQYGTVPDDMDDAFTANTTELMAIQPSSGGKSSLNKQRTVTGFNNPMTFSMTSDEGSEGSGGSDVCGRYEQTMKAALSRSTTMDENEETVTVDVNIKDVENGKQVRFAKSVDNDSNVIWLLFYYIIFTIFSYHPH